MTNRHEPGRYPVATAPASVSIARFAGFGFYLLVYPALKCWAIVVRPLRGLGLEID